MTTRLPNDLAEKAACFPETSYGATVVTLVLEDGTHVSNVTLAWGRDIVKVGSCSVQSDAELDFNLGEVKDVLPIHGTA